MGSITADQYFAGVIGLSLLRNWYVDADANEARMTELSAVFAGRAEFPYSLRLDPQERALLAGYAEWAEVYDGPNPLIEAEELVVRPLLDRLAQPDLRALDAACGTGRHAAYLRDLGCTVTGVDQSREMLTVARSKVSDVRFDQGDIEQLPFADASFDLVVISLALTHLADPTPAIQELARVLRPGGSLVIADPHAAAGLVGGQAFYGGIVPGRPMAWVRNHYHSASTWLRAFRTAGLLVEDCIEPPMGRAQIESSPASLVFPDATRTAVEGLPGLWVWELRRASPDGRSAGAAT